MLFDLDPIFLARLQFAFTIGFHIIFPAFTIGLASFLAVVEWRWLVTQDERFQHIYKLWVKIFAVAFGMGVVSGVVMSYQLGTNWSVFSDKVSNVLGPLFGFEVLTAFFLEASFLGVMLFGWGRVSKRMHFFSTCIVALGTLISAFWIIAANSWMHTPAGFEIAADGRLYPVNWIDIIFNPSFPFRLMHMVTAAYLTTAFVIGGTGAYYLLKHQYVPHARIMLGMATLMAVFVPPIQILLGDLHGLNTLQHQPAKIAAIEGLWETARGVPLQLFAWPHQAEGKSDYVIEIPKLASVILTRHKEGEVKGLNAWPKEDWPSVPIVFFSFRIMVGIGILMLLMGLISAIQYFRGKLFSTRALHQAWMLMMPSGFVAILAGWFVTEVGRQPYVVYNVLKTSAAVSPAIIGPQVAGSLLLFVIIYIFIFSAGIYYILALIRKGMKVTQEKEQYYRHTIEATALAKPSTGDSND